MTIHITNVVGLCRSHVCDQAELKRFVTLQWRPPNQLDLVLACVQCKSHIRFTPESGHVRCNKRCPLWANSGHCRESITPSARCWSCSEMLRPNAFAVLRLITRSYFVGACTGSSPGLSPLRIRSTYEAASRCCSTVSKP